MAGESSWGDTFKSTVGNLWEFAQQIPTAVSNASGVVAQTRDAVSDFGRTPDPNPVWTNDLIARQQWWDVNRGAVGTTESGSYLNASNFSAAFSTTETLLLFGAALLAGWAFTKF